MLLVLALASSIGINKTSRYCSTHEGQADVYCPAAAKACVSFACEVIADLVLLLCRVDESSKSSKIV